MDASPTSVTVSAIVVEAEPARTHRVQVIVDDELHGWLLRKQTEGKRGKRKPSLSIVGYRLLQALKNAEDKQATSAATGAVGIGPRATAA